MWHRSTIIIIIVSFTAAVDQPKPQKPAERPQPESWGWIGVYVGLTAAALSVCIGLYLLLSSHK